MWSPKPSLGLLGHFMSSRVFCKNELGVASFHVLGLGGMLCSERANRVFGVVARLAFGYHVWSLPRLSPVWCTSGRGVRICYWTWWPRMRSRRVCSATMCTLFQSILVMRAKCGFCDIRVPLMKVSQHELTPSTSRDRYTQEVDTQLGRLS